MSASECASAARRIAEATRLAQSLPAVIEDPVFTALAARLIAARQVQCERQQGVYASALSPATRGRSGE